MHPKHHLLLKKNAKRIAHTGNDKSHRAFYFALDKDADQEVLHIDRKIKVASKFNTVKKLNRTLEPFQDDEYALGQKSKLCSGMVSRGEDGNLVFDVQIKRGLGANVLARSLKRFKRYIGIASILKDGVALDVDSLDDGADLDGGDVIDPVLDDAEAEEDDLDLAAEIAEELAEANLADQLFADGEQSTASVSYFLLQQQEIFRRDDDQLDPVLKPDELSFTLNGAPQPLDAALLKATGLGDMFVLTDEGLRVKDRYLTDGAISPDERDALAAALVTAVASVPGLTMKLSNPGSDGADMELFARDDGTFGQLVDRRAVAGPDNLQFDRRRDIVPGSEPARSFLDVVQEMNHADDASFAALNGMLADAYALEKAEGRISPDMSFQQYKMQFVDLEVGGVMESGLQWHDGTGALGAEEWAFLQLKVQDLPDRTQNNYYIQMSWKGMSGKPIERKLDINCSGTVMNQLIADKDEAKLKDWIYQGLADEEWSRSGLGIAEGDRAGLIAAYKGHPIEVKLGYWNARGKLTWDPSEGTRAALINTMDGRDLLEPLVNDIPAGALKTLLADEQGAPKNLDGSTADLSTDEGLQAAREKATDGIASTIQTTALTAWTQNSTEAMSELLSDIPDVQKVFLRQSNGVVNSVRIANTDVRGAMDALSAVPQLSGEVEELSRLLSQPGVSQSYVKRAADKVKRRLQKVEGRLDDEQAEALYDAIETIAKTEIKDIGQTEVITSGNDTGAFGKCAPTSYFCAALCGVSRGAREGFDLLLGGSPNIQDAAKRLEEMFTTGAMTDERREAIDEQIKVIEGLVDELSEKREEALQDLWTDPEWVKADDTYNNAQSDLLDKENALLAERREIQRVADDPDEFDRIKAGHESQLASLITDREDKAAAVQLKKDELALYATLKDNGTAMTVPSLAAKGDSKAYTWKQLRKMEHPDYPGKTFHDVKLMWREETVPADEAALALLDEQAGKLEEVIADLDGMAERMEAIAAEIVALDEQRMDLHQQYRADAEALYADKMAAIDDEIAARKKGIEHVKKFKASVADRMAVSVDPDDGQPCMNMAFPVPQSALNQSAGDYNGGWLIKKLNDLAKKPENAGRDLTAIGTEDLGMRYDSESKQWMMDVKVKCADIQEYLEQTNREDKYRGGKKHMMDFFKDPSSMNNIQLMKSLGPGLIAVGVDKMLKTMGKDSGLLYGPSADVVATMVYNEQKVSEYEPISRPIPKPDEDPEGYKKEFARRRKSMLDKLTRTESDGGAMSVSMGYSNANGHVNYVVDWGTPTIGGVDISSDDVARCRMNLAENTATSSAWNNDRVQDFPINTAAMGRGIDGLLGKLRGAGKDDADPNVARLLELKANADAATAAMDRIAKRLGGMSAEKLAHLRQSGLNAYWNEIEEITTQKCDELEKRLLGEGKSPEEADAEVKKQKPAFEREAKTTAWSNRTSDEKVAINRWGKISEDSGYAEALDLIRKAAGEMSDFLKATMKLQKGADLDEENVLIMPSNTERDNRVSDNEEDRSRVGGGQIGSQKYGSANATDAVYCVPLNCLASGLNGEITDDPDDPENKKCSATAYNYKPDSSSGSDVPDQFVILTSMSTMLARNA